MVLGIIGGMHREMDYDEETRPHWRLDFCIAVIRRIEDKPSRLIHCKDK